MSNTVTSLNPECIGCMNIEETICAKDGALTLLATLRAGLTVDDAYKALCFAHRRLVDDATKEVENLIRMRG